MTDTMAECPPPTRLSLLFRTPLWIRVVIAVALGSLFGAIFKTDPIVFNITTDHLGQIGMLPVKLLRALAIPLIFFAILDGFVKTSIPLHRAGKLILICLINVSVAMCIGLLILNLLHPVRHWQGNIHTLVAQV